MTPLLTAFRAFVLAIVMGGIIPTHSLAADQAPDPVAEQAGHQRLADLLEDEATRKALIEQLRKLGEDQAANVIAADQGAQTVAGRIAGLTQQLAQDVIDESLAAMSALRAAWTQLRAADPQALLWVLGEFAVLVAVTLIALRVLGAAARPAFRALDRYGATAEDLRALGWIRRTLAVVGAALVDLVTIGLAWLAGYGIALFMLGEQGSLRIQESLFLNAFLAVELILLVLRMLLSQRGEHLGILPMDVENKAYWSAWAGRMVHFLGYGLMWLVPVIEHHLTPELGRAVVVLLLLSGVLRAGVVVMQNRQRGRLALEALGERMQTSFGRISMTIGARIWHVVALVYLAAVLVTSVLYPEDALPFMLRATGQTLLAVLLGIASAALLTQVILRRISIGEDMRRKFPLLEARLNAYVPTALKACRFVILAVVLAFVADAWTPFDFAAWVGSDAGGRFMGTTVSVALIIALALLVWLVVASWIEFRLNAEVGGAANPRARTLLTIFRNAVAIALVVLTTMVVLAEIGINIAPLLAGAGVLGLAIGFGAQKLVQDVITGVFIQLERAIDVGDTVTAGGVTGTVERMTIRSLGLRDLSGTYHLLPFSSVDTVANYNRDFAYHVGEYGIGYREDTDEAVAHLRAAFDELVHDPVLRDQIIGDELEVHGVTALADSSVNIRVRIKTRAGSQFPVGRAYNRLVKRHFDAAGVEIPYPHMTLYFGEDKQGKAPPAHLKLVGDEEAAPVAVSGMRPA